MDTAQVKLVRYSEENPNEEALKGKWGSLGESWGCITVLKNVLLVVAYKGANVDVKLPEVYDGFVQCSDGICVAVEDSTLHLALADNVSASGILKLKKDN